MIKQKIVSILMIAITIPVAVMESDITLLVMMALISVPMFFTKKQVFF